MMDRTRADAAAALFQTAIEQAGGVKEGCLALIAAAAGQHLLRGVMAEAEVDDMLSVLSVAVAVLVDDESGGALDLVPSADHA